MRLAALVLCAACSSPSKPVAVATPPPPADAAVDASPDAGVPESAATWRFRFTTPARGQVWVLRFGNGHAIVEIQTEQGTARIFGTAEEGPSVKIDVSSTTARYTLDCKRVKKPLSANKCNDVEAKPVDVLDCYVQDFKEPMPFAVDPGVEYIVEKNCYRLIPAS